MKKSLIAVLLCAFVALAFTACKAKPTEENKPSAMAPISELSSVPASESEDAPSEESSTLATVDGGENGKDDAVEFDIEDEDGGKEKTTEKSKDSKEDTKEETSKDSSEGSGGFEMPAIPIP